MTALSKIKTLIEYARFGASMSRWSQGRRGEIYLPRPIKSIGWNTQFFWRNLANATIFLNAPYLLSLQDNDMCGNEHMVKVYAPKCTSINNASAMFRGAKGLKEVDLSSLRSLTHVVFSGCTSLEVLKLGAMTNLTPSAIADCTALHTLIVGKETHCNLDFRTFPLLTQECMHTNIDNVADRTGTYTSTLTVHQDVYDRISEEYKTKLSNKNWNLAIGS